MIFNFFLNISFQLPLLLLLYKGICLNLNPQKTINLFWIRYIHGRKIHQKNSSVCFIKAATSGGGSKLLLQLREIQDIKTTELIIQSPRQTKSQLSTVNGRWLQWNLTRNTSVKLIMWVWSYLSILLFIQGNWCILFSVNFLSYIGIVLIGFNLCFSCCISLYSQKTLRKKKRCFWLLELQEQRIEMILERFTSSDSIPSTYNNGNGDWHRVSKGGSRADS